MRRALVVIDASFEAVLATVLLFGIVYAVIDEDDFPGPASDVVNALFALALYVGAVTLMTLVKNDAVTAAVLRGLAIVNAGFALLLAIWALVADGFTATGQTVVWITVAVLLALAAAQALSASAPSTSASEPE